MFNYLLTVSIFIFTSSSSFSQDIKRATQIKNDDQSTHEILSYRLTQFATHIDGFFSDDSQLNFENKTRIRILHDTFFQEDKKKIELASVQLQLKLPRIQKKLQFILERDSDQNEDDTNSNIIGITPVRIPEKNNTRAGFRYFLDLQDIKTTFGSGIIFRNIRPILFTRFRVRKNIHYKYWLFKPEQEINWVDKQGIRSRTELDFDHKINDYLLIRLVNNISWNDTDHEIKSRNGPSLYQKINEKIGMSYNARMISSDTPSLSTNNYSISIGYRQLLYKRWLFWTISPSLDFPRHKNFRRSPNINIRFEAIIGYI